MTKKEDKGLIWFKKTFCDKCTALEHCGIDTIVCIEAEKLRILRNPIDVRTE